MTPYSSSIPVEVIFNPNWWFRNYGISFDESFYLGFEQRIINDVAMRRALHERFGIGEANQQPRPIIGSQHTAGVFNTALELRGQQLFMDLLDDEEEDVKP